MTFLRGRFYQMRCGRCNRAHPQPFTTPPEIEDLNRRVWADEAGDWVAVIGEWDERTQGRTWHYEVCPVCVEKIEGAAEAAHAA